MGLRGDLSSIRGMKAALKKLPLTVAHDVSKRAAPAMTGLTQEAHAARKGVYGDPYPAGVKVERTGATKATMKFVAQGTIVRCVLGTPYAKYLIGKYSILPNGALPVAWSRKLAELVAQTKVTP